MEDIEILKLELKGIRAKNAALEQEVKVLRRYRQIVERSSELVRGMPSTMDLEAVQS
jgi:FtsZ-binding cell division protein ZapB